MVHDWFNEAGGAEKVVKEILHCYPEADVFCLFDFFSGANRHEYLMGKKTQTSYIQNIPFARRRYRNLFPLFPHAIETLSLRKYPVIISSSSCVAKGIIRHPGQLHISYCHSPARYAWDLMDDYLKAAPNSISRGMLRYFFNRLQQWDYLSSHRVDHFIANSQFVAGRINKYFGRDSTVIYPPVEVSIKEPAGPRRDTYFSVSRLVIYKNVDLIIEAFRRMPELKLEIAGDGPLRNRIMKNLPSNVTYLGYIDDETKRQKISTAKAFVAAATEDFGISIVEAQSYCTPVIIPEVGGYKETVNDKTGVFFVNKTPDEMVKTIRTFHHSGRSFGAADFEANIRRFCTARFRDEFKSFVDEQIRKQR